MRAYELGHRPPYSQYRRRRRYFALMGAALVLFVTAGAFVGSISVTAAVAMCVVAALIVPFAVIAGNRWQKGDKWWDER
jgi:ABC-type multidrug transport system permease subunit